MSRKDVLIANVMVNRKSFSIPIRPHDFAFSDGVLYVFAKDLNSGITVSMQVDLASGKVSQWEANAGQDLPPEYA